MTRLAAVASTLLLGVAVVGAQTTKTDPALSRIAADFGAAATAGNAAKVAAHYTADATFMPPNEPMVKGRANIQAWFQKHMDAGAITLKLQPVESRISGDLAFEAGTFSFGVKPKTGQPANDTGKYIVVLRKEGNDWKISHDIFNSDLPPPPPAK
jgi:ketosteroid isomerase-like protein